MRKLRLGLESSRDSINLNASGTVIGYQGFAKDQVAGIAKLSAGATRDPLDTSIYTTYATNVLQTKMQVMNFLEDGSKVTAYIPGTFEIQDAFAVAGTSYSNRSPVSRGDSLGILLGSTGSSLNQPVQELYTVGAFTGVDVVNTSTGYTVIYGNRTSERSTGTGTVLVGLKNNMKLGMYDANLIGYWDMETVTPNGLLADLSGNGNNLIGNGGVTVGMVPGKYGNATLFDGNNDVFVANGTGDLNITTNAFTIVSVVKPYSLAGASHIVCKGAGWVTDYSYGLAFHQPSGGWMINLTKDGVNVNTNQTPPYKNDPSNVYYVIATVWDGTNSKLFRNGTMIGNVPFSSNNLFQSATKFNLGGNGWDNKWNGLIDEVRMYNRALSDSEIQNLYNVN